MPDGAEETEPALELASPTGAELQKNLQQYAVKRIDIRVFEYSSNESNIAEDIQSASVVMMPSRAEGFGLVAIEAIAAGRPVLVSDRSGYADILQAICPDYARHFVVLTNDDLDMDGEAWSNALERVLRDRETAFGMARDHRVRFNAVLSWDASVARLLSKMAPR